MKFLTPFAMGALFVAMIVKYGIAAEWIVGGLCK